MNEQTDLRRDNRTAAPLIMAVACVLLLPPWMNSATVWAQNPFGESPFGESTAGDSVNPFGAASDPGDGNGFGGFAPAAPVAGNSAAASEATAATEVEDDPDPVVQAVRQQPPETPEEMAKALTWLVRIKRFDEAKRWLDHLATLNWNQQELAQLARSGGSSLWVRLRAPEAELSAAQSKLISEIFTAPAELARDLTSINGWIDRLASKSAGQRRLAQLRLQDASLVAVQRLIDRLLAGDALVPAEMLAGTILEFGRDGIEALQTACWVKDPARAARVLMALADLPGTHFYPELGAATVSPLLATEHQTALRAKLEAKHSKLPSPAAVSKLLTKRFDDSLAEYQERRSQVAMLPITLWRVTTDGATIERVEAKAADLPLERLAQLAGLRLRLPTATADELRDCGAALLQRAYQISPQLRDPQLASHLLLPLTATQLTTTNLLEQVYTQATTWQMHGGALRAIELLGKDAGDSAATAPLGFLSKRLLDSRPSVRYSAFSTLARLNPQHAYLGAETALHTALEIMQLGNGPHALVIGGQSDRRQTAVNQIQMQTSAATSSANTARNAFIALDRETPTELVVIVDRVADQSIFQLIQRLRGGKRSSALPIAVLTDELYQYERELIDRTPGVIHSVLSTDPQQMARVLMQLANSLDTVPLTAVERSQLAIQAGDFLATIAANRTQYAFYPLGDIGSHLMVEANNFLPRARIDVLSGLGTAESQRKLIAMASQESLEETHRLAAARAFGSSVRSFGMSLGQQDILANYDLYNQLAPQDPVALRALGHVLDVSEAHAGKAEWPTPSW
ncbi:hypothetical protein [Aureliella helgolandensis]|nr:hypothetical protein [Aureliella helgolandensis]